MRAVPVLWKVFVITQLVGLGAMVLTGLYPRLEEAPLTLIWAVLLLPGIIVGKPIVGRALALHDAPDALLVPLTTVSIIVVNAVFWFCLPLLLRVSIRTLKGLTRRCS
jgi:hypothetical protein